jgi:hypothetical protein
VIYCIWMCKNASGQHEREQHCCYLYHFLFLGHFPLKLDCTIAELGNDARASFCRRSGMVVHVDESEEIQRAQDRFLQRQCAPSTETPNLLSTE